MKKTVLTTAIVIILSAGQALADNQVYSPYGQSTNYAARNAQQQQAASQQHVQKPNTFMVYPGREQYGQNFGRIPRHPGDYRDAVDRGTWGGGDVGARSFDIR